MTDCFYGTKGEVIAYIAKINRDVMGYPSSDGKTLRYSLPTPHMGKLNNGGQPTEHFMFVAEVFSPKLNRRGTMADINGASTQSEKTAKRKTFATLQSEGAFNWPSP